MPDSPIYLVRGKSKQDVAASTSAAKAVRIALVMAKRGLDGAAVRDPLARRLRTQGSAEVDGVTVTALELDVYAGQRL